MVYLYNILPGMFGILSGAANSLKAEGKATAYWIVLGLAIFLAAAVPYIFGSFNSAIIVSKYKYHQDIRNYGSGNAGLTNMYRVYGKSGAGLTLLGDIGKQILSVLFGIIMLGQYGAYLAGGFCMIGHILPVFYNFKGGKGVLTAATMILLIDPMIFCVLIVVFILVLLITRYVSLASIMAAFTYPAAVYYAERIRTGNNPDMFQMLFALFIGCVIIYMHRSNIYRIFNNQETKFSFRKKPETQEILDMEDRENDEDNTYYPPARKKKKNKK